MRLPFIDRTAAGLELANKLHSYQDRDDAIVLALPRGGVPVAYEVAMVLHIKLDVLIVRKLGIPGHEEYAMGAIASGGVQFLNHHIIQAHHISNQEIAKVLQTQQQELLRREQTYRGARPWLNLNKLCVILIDDGLATGATMRVAIAAVRKQQVSKIVVATPIAPVGVIQELSALVDEIICLATPTPFFAVSQWYLKFNQTADEEVRCLLTKAWQQKQSENNILQQSFI